MTDTVLASTTALALLTAITVVIVLAYVAAVIAGRITATILGHLLHSAPPPKGAAGISRPVRIVRTVTDPDRAIEVLRQVGADLASDDRYRPSILEPLEILGVDGFTDSQVTIKIRIKTLPLRQWDVGRELRRRIKKAFDQQAIEMPSRTTVYVPSADR